MGILTRTKLLPNERFDLEDYLAEQSAARTDSLLHTKSFKTEVNKIVAGFSVTGIGLTQLTIVMPGSALYIPQSSTDFSWYTAAPSEPNITVPASSLTDGGRNYVEIGLVAQDGTPVTRAFWDPNANSGAGAEFNQTVDTMTDLSVVAFVLTGGFSGSPDRLPVAIVDVNGSGVVKTIFDRRELYHRLAKPENLDNSFAWGTKQEPVYTLALTGVTGTFVAGESLTVGGETATCVVGGTTNIQMNSPTGDNFLPGSQVIGATSGAVATLDTSFESFTGADKSIINDRQDLDAVKTEIKNMKGTRYWWQDAPASLSALDTFSDSFMIQAIVGSIFQWDGNNLSILNTNVGSPSAADILGYIRILGKSQNIGLCRQDGTGGSSVIGLTEKQVLFVNVPSSGDISYSGVGVGSTNYQIATLSNFVVTPNNFWIAYREEGLLYIREGGVLAPGGTTPIGGSSGTGTGGINTVTCFDPYDLTLPTGASAVIDGHTIADQDLVLFTNLSSGNNQVYKANGVGTSITWTPQSVFNGQITPVAGDLVEVAQGTNYASQLAAFNGTAWSVNDIVRHFNSAGDFWEESSIRTVSIPSSSSGAFLTVPAISISNLIIDFSILVGSAKDIGTLYVTQNGSQVSIATGGTELGVTGVDFTATFDGGGNLNINYVSGSGAGTMKYSVKYWSDLPGGPNGLPNYPAYQNVQAGSLNSAYATSDGSGMQVNCDPPTLVGGLTRMHFNFNYAVGVSPGTTTGELEVIVDGDTIPRFVSGVTVDAYYKEIDQNTVEFWTDLTPTPISLEVRRRQGSINIDVQSNTRLRAYYDLVVGSVAQVADGSADFSTISGAVSAAAVGAKILVLQGTYTENVSVNKMLMIQGKGYGSQLLGDITFTSASAKSSVKDLFLNGNIIFASGSSKNMIADSWFSTTGVLSDLGTTNAYLTLVDG